MRNSILSTVVFVFLTSTANAGLLFNYSQLTMKDLDQMNSMVIDKVKESKKSTSGKIVPLKEALQAVYSRPNRDGMIEKVVAPLRTALDEQSAWEEVLNQLTSESVNALKNTKSFKPVVQVTYQIFLENLLIEMKPYFANNGFEKKLAEQVRDAKIELSKESLAERKLRLMESTESPSALAERLLNEVANATK